MVDLHEMVCRSEKVCRSAMGNGFAAWIGRERAAAKQGQNYYAACLEQNVQHRCSGMDGTTITM